MRYSREISMLLAAMLLSGCAAGAAAVGAAAVGGYAVAQERSVGDAIDDNAIALQINASMTAESPELFAATGVEVVEGRVLLVGSVPSPLDRVAAGRIAWSVPGVREVLNEIQVTGYGRQSVGNYATDALISNTLRARLIADTSIRARNYSVETVNGVVYLMGVARDKLELERAAYVARTIAGVNRVVSHVLLADDPRRTVARVGR